MSKRTRIKVVKDNFDTLYCPQYKFLFWWFGIAPQYSLYGPYQCADLKNAQIVIDAWLEKQSAYENKDRFEKEKRRTKVISYIDYP